MNIKVAVDPVTFDPCEVDTSSPDVPPRLQTPEYVILGSLSSTTIEVELN